MQNIIWDYPVCVKDFKIQQEGPPINPIRDVRCVCIQDEGWSVNLLKERLGMERAGQVAA